jgi:sugar phosphate isomerase/epimerase
MAGALEKVGRLGYKSVEFAGFFGIPAERIKALLDVNGLKVSGTHTGLQELVGHYDETVAYHRAIGNRNIIIPYESLENQEKIDTFTRVVNELQPKLGKEGIRLGYHNHAHEFAANQDGSVSFDQLVERTSLDLELDIFWAYHAGKDPVALMERLKGRLTFLHLKDGLPDGEGRPLGEGAAPVAQVWKKAAEMGIHMVVESETLTPDGLTEAKKCMEYLRSLE